VGHIPIPPKLWRAGEHGKLGPSTIRPSLLQTTGRPRAASFGRWSAGEFGKTRAERSFQGGPHAPSVDPFPVLAPTMRTMARGGV
jgi:hypothetical protein